LTVEQYRQLHEMRREYNRFIFQAPTIVVAIAVGTFAVLFRGNSVPDLGTTFAWVLFGVGVFVLIIGYWALRSRKLLRLSEKSLMDLERRHGHRDVKMYPDEFKKPEMPRLLRLSSTLLIAWSVVVLGVVLLGVAIYMLRHPVPLAPTAVVHLRFF
jgi:O-antigen/teichoic acid export membrane protein